MQIGKIITSFRNICIKPKPLMVRSFNFPWMGGVNFREVPVDRMDPFHVASGYFKVTQSPDILEVSGVNTCIALSLYDPKSKVGGLMHLSGANAFEKNIHQDIVIPIIREMVNAKANREYLEYRLLGGSEYSNTASFSRIYIDRLKDALREEKVKLVEETAKLFSLNCMA